MRSVICLFLAAALCPVLCVPADADLEPLFRAFLRDNYPWAEIKVMEFTAPHDVGASQVDRFIVERGLPGSTGVLIVLKDGSVLKAGAVVRAFDPVVMTARPLQKGHVLSEQDLYLSLVDVARIPKNAFRQTGDLVGATLLRQAGSNVVITELIASRHPVVKRGKRVMLVVESPSFRIVAPGETREHGAVGKDVKAINLVSKRAVQGVLLDEDTVKVEY